MVLTEGWVRNWIHRFLEIYSVYTKISISLKHLMQIQNSAINKFIENCFASYVFELAKDL